MTGAENLITKIQSDARRAADDNLTQARREAEEIVLKAREEAQAIQASLMAKAERDANGREKRLISVAELENRKEKLAAKQRLIDEAFDRAVRILCDKPDPEYEAMLVDMIANTASGGEEIILSERDAGRLSDGFISSVEKAVKSKGKPGGLSLSDETRPIMGGFILRAEQTEINSSFEAIIKMQKDSLESLAVKMLFNS